MRRCNSPNAPTALNDKTAEMARQMASDLEELLG